MLFGGDYSLNRNMARILLLTAGLIWASGFLVNKYVLNQGWDDSQLLFVRFFTASVFIFLLFPKRIIKTDKSTIKIGLFLGLFMFFGFFFQTWGIALTTASKNAIITAGYIIFLPIITYLFERKWVPTKTILAALITFVGIVLVSLNFSDSTGSINLGDFLTFIGAIFWGIHIYLLGKNAKKKDPVALMAFQLLVVSALSFISMMIQTGFPQVDFHTTTSWTVLLASVLIGFFASFVAFVLQSIGQKHTNETEAAILISSESFFGPLMAILILHDPVHWNILLGMVIVFFGFLLSETDWLTRKRKIT